MAASLPLEFSSAIFLRTDDDQPNNIQVLITGPEDTPYTGGCFLFDLNFPGSYPEKPPQVKFRTTGNGKVRFNPNLYNNGKVCLSLLGTWQGAEGEEWNSTSTVLQVLVSIQSLILCSEPFYNEPGFQSMYGTAKGDSQSLKYSEDVFLNNLKYGVLDQLSNPPDGFKNVVKAHFFMKKDALMTEFEKWSQKFKNHKIDETLATVKQEFLKLKAPVEHMDFAN